MKKIIPFLLLLLLLSLGSKPYNLLDNVILPAEDYSYKWLLYQKPAEQKESLPLRRISEYAEYFEQVAAAENVPVSILESVANAESDFIPTARSPKRADGFCDVGMFQFHSKYLDWYAEKYNDGIDFDPFDYRISAVIAARHLKALYEYFGSWPKAVMGYNCGASRVEVDDIPDSTYLYLDRVWN